MMLSKNSFIRSINFIKERMEGQDAIGKLFKKEFDDSIFWPYCKYETELIRVLKEIFQDTENEWIDYFIYELDFGKRWKPNTITEKDKTGKVRDIPLGTVEDLYNLLLEDMSEYT